jgi:hypothetical protein
MPINLNLWSLMLGRWLSPDRDDTDLTTHARRDASQHRDGGESRWRDRPPPLNLVRLSAHMRRDIGLDLDRV